MQTKLVSITFLGILSLIVAGFAAANVETDGGFWVEDSAVKFVGWDYNNKAECEFWIDVRNEMDTAVAVDVMAIFFDWREVPTYTKWRHYTSLIASSTTMRFFGTFLLPSNAPQYIDRVDWMLRVSGTGDYPKWKFDPEEYGAWLLWNELCKLKEKDAK